MRETRTIETIQGTGQVVSSDGLSESVAYSIRIVQEFKQGVPGLKDTVGELSFQSPSMGLADRLDPFWGNPSEIYLEDQSSQWRRIRIKVLEVSSGGARFEVADPGRAFG